MSEVKCSTCKGVGRLEFEQGQRRVPCVTCSGSGIDWRKTCDAQRLRADTAEGALEVANRTLAMFADDLQVAEKRIAEHESMLRHFANCADRFQVGTAALDYVAALNPNPEAESHESSN